MCGSDAAVEKMVTVFRVLGLLAQGWMYPPPLVHRFGKNGVSSVGSFGPSLTPRWEAITLSKSPQGPGLAIVDSFLSLKCTV